MRSALCLVVSLLLAAPAAAQDMPLSQILLRGEGWELVSKDLMPPAHAKSFGGPRSLAADRAGAIYVATGKGVLHFDKGSKPRVFAPNWELQRIHFAPDGRVYAIQGFGAARIVAFDGEGKETVIVKGIRATDREGRDAFWPTDFVITASGRLYYAAQVFKDFRSRVYLSGRKAPVDPEAPISPSGMVLWPDGGTLVVGDNRSGRLYAYRIEKDGTLTAKEAYYTLRARPGQRAWVGDLAVDATGRLYAATEDGVQVFDPTGRLSGVLLGPERAPVSALAFGGPDFDRLYVLCNDKLYVRKLKAKGVPPPGAKKK